MMTIDLNCDLGESFGNYKIGMDAEIMNYISSTNIACGYHAGDAYVMQKTIDLALKNNVSIGAHPGYPDLQGFGRRPMNVPYNELFAMVQYQVSALKGMTESAGGKLNHVKAHGALYNQAAKSEEVALALIDAVKSIDENIILYGLANSLFIDLAEKNGMKTASEVFADRSYMDDGSLVPRNVEGAVIHDIDQAKDRVFEMVKGSVKCISGNQISMKSETVCIHGDNPEAVSMAKCIYEYLISKGVTIKSL